MPHTFSTSSTAISDESQFDVVGVRITRVSYGTPSTRCLNSTTIFILTPSRRWFQPTLPAGKAHFIHKGTYV